MSEVKAKDDDIRHGKDEDVEQLSFVDQVALTVGVGWWHTAGAAALGLDGVH